MTSLPWITCVCVSKNRPGFLKKAIAQFKMQTYQNKDLVVVHEGLDESWKETGLPNDWMKVINLPDGSPLSLGERRNLSIRNCRGKYFCLWDDDDWFHCRRLELQMEALMNSGRSASLLGRILLYDGTNHRAYLSSQRCWEGTLLCKTDLISPTICYNAIDRNEDNSLIVSLVNKDHVQLLSIPYLYIYNFHGNNTWHQAHFNLLFQAGYPLGKSANNLVSKILTEQIGHPEASQRIEKLKLGVLR